MVTWFTSHSAVGFSIESATSNDFVPLARRTTIATWLLTNYTFVDLIHSKFTQIHFSQIKKKALLKKNLEKCIPKANLLLV